MHPKQTEKLSWFFCGAVGTPANSLLLQPRAVLEQTFLWLTMTESLSDVPFLCLFPFPTRNVAYFCLPKLLNKVKREGLGKRRQCSWTQKNHNDLEKKVKKMATPFYSLIAIFGVGQILETKESTWLLGRGEL